MSKNIPKPFSSNKTVQKATGKTWPQWFTILDKFPQGKTHTERAAWLYQHHLAKGWWCQMVTVTYEQARGLRQKHENPQGFAVSASKTMPVATTTLYQWFTNPAKQKEWLRAKGFTITTATPGKSVRIKWSDGSRVDVGFYAKGPTKSSANVGHEKLKSAAAAKKQQNWWREQLELLAAMVSKP